LIQWKLRLMGWIANWLHKARDYNLSRKWYGIELEILKLKDKVLQLVLDKDKVINHYKVIDLLNQKKEIIHRFIFNKELPAQMSESQEISLLDLNRFHHKKIW
jgi:hypothetical protein